jgi:hypothetical protein
MRGESRRERGRSVLIRRCSSALPGAYGDVNPIVLQSDPNRSARHYPSCEQLGERRRVDLGRLADALDGDVAPTSGLRLRREIDQTRDTVANHRRVAAPTQARPGPGWRLP